MESTLPSERVATVRGDNEQQRVHDGIGMDGQREYQRVCQGP